MIRRARGGGVQRGFRTDWVGDESALCQEAFEVGVSESGADGLFGLYVSDVGGTLTSAALLEIWIETDSVRMSGIARRISWCARDGVGGFCFRR